MASIQDTYKDILKRDPTADELRSEQENAQRYGQGWVDDQLRKNLTERNAPTGDRQYDSQSREGDQLYGSGTNNPTNTPGGAQGSSSFSSSQSMFPDWYKDIMLQNQEMQKNQFAQQMEAQTRQQQYAQQAQQQAAQLAAQQFEYQKQQEVAQRAKADSLFGTLLNRSQQGLAVDRNDPIIRAQADANAANLSRERRSYLSDTAERSGPYANMQGERRMTAERAGQAAGGFEAALLGRELQSRRDEISEALSGMQGILSADQQNNLQRQLSLMDNAIRQTQLGQQGSSALNTYGLGLGDLGLRGQQVGNQNAQFYAGLGSENDRFAASLGFNATDRARYWDSIMRGLKP